MKFPIVNIFYIKLKVYMNMNNVKSNNRFILSNCEPDNWHTDLIYRNEHNLNLNNFLFLHLIFRLAWAYVGVCECNLTLRNCFGTIDDKLNFWKPLSIRCLKNRKVMTELENFLFATVQIESSKIQLIL